MQSYMRFKYCDNEEYKEKLRKEYMEKTLPAHLNVFSSRLENDKQWLVGDKVKSHIYSKNQCSASQKV